MPLPIQLRRQLTDVRVQQAMALLPPKTVPAAPAINPFNSCGSSVLTAANYTGALLWNTGATTPSITVTNAGAYTATQTVNGCTSPAGSGTAGPVLTPPVPKITTVDNCGNSVLTASDYTGTLLWSNGQTTPTITVTVAGSYTLTQTVNGCTSPRIETRGGQAEPKAIPSAPAVITADNCGNSVLTASNYSGTLLWSTGAGTPSITVTTGGTYTATQTAANGCVSPNASGGLSPKLIPAAPAVSVVNNCGNSVLTASDYTGSLVWNRGETTPSITVTVGRTYTVKQIAANGCISPLSSAVAVPKPIPAATGSICGSGQLFSARAEAWCSSQIKQQATYGAPVKAHKVSL
ncbi:MAG: hypothetical protein WDO16_13530 [Bacteroidota bacterium]